MLAIRLLDGGSDEFNSSTTKLSPTLARLTVGIIAVAHHVAATLPI